MLPMRRADLLTRTIEGEVVILDRASDRVHQLNATASCIWEGCDGTRTPEQIAALVGERFDAAPESLLHDVLQTLANLERLGLLASRGTMP